MVLMKYLKIIDLRSTHFTLVAPQDQIPIKSKKTGADKSPDSITSGRYDLNS